MRIIIVLGVIVGGIFVELTTWRWIMWFMGIVGITVAAVSTVVVPPSAPRRDKPSWRRLDLGGASLITGMCYLPLDARPVRAQVCCSDLGPQ